MRTSIRAIASAGVAIGVLALATPWASSAPSPARATESVAAAAPAPPQLEFDQAQATAANGPPIDADETRICGATGGKRFLAEILEGSPLDFKIPYRLGDVVDGNTVPTSMAH